MPNIKYTEKQNLQITFHPFAIGCGERLDGLDTGWRSLPAPLLEIPSGGQWEVHTGTSKQPQVIADGELLLIPANEKHRLFCRAQGRMKTFFMLASYRHFSGTDVMLAAKFPAKFPVEAGSGLKPLIEQAGTVFEESYKSLSGAAKLHQIAFTILDLLLAYASSDMINRDDYRLERISWAIKTIDGNPAGSHSCHELARQSGLSPSRFNAVFKEITGIPPQEYIRNARIKHASALLLNSDLPVYHVADACGFDSAAYFCRYFARHTGMSPAAFRREFH